MEQYKLYLYPCLQRLSSMESSHPLGLGLEISLFSGQCECFITQVKQCAKVKTKIAKASNLSKD